MEQLERNTPGEINMFLLIRDLLEHVAACWNLQHPCHVLLTSCFKKMEEWILKVSLHNPKPYSSFPVLFLSFIPINNQQGYCRVLRLLLHGVETVTKSQRNLKQRRMEVGDTSVHAHVWSIHGYYSWFFRAL